MRDFRGAVDLQALPDGDGLMRIDIQNTEGDVLGSHRLTEGVVTGPNGRSMNLPRRPP